MSIRNIAEGWINFALDSAGVGLSDKLQQMITLRAETCRRCPSLVERPATIGGIPVSSFKCGECGCAFPHITYAPQKECPLGLWESVVDEDEEDILTGHTSVLKDD